MFLFTPFLLPLLLLLEEPFSSAEIESGSGNVTDLGSGQFTEETPTPEETPPVAGPLSADFAGERTSWSSVKYSMLSASAK